MKEKTPEQMSVWWELPKMSVTIIRKTFPWKMYGGDYGLYCSQPPGGWCFVFTFRRSNVNLHLWFSCITVWSCVCQRALEPPDVHHERLLPVSVAGLIVNLVGIFVFQHGGHGHSHGDGGTISKTQNLSWGSRTHLADRASLWISKTSCTWETTV